MAEYHFNSLNPTSFQRLVNAVLAARFGERLKVMPLRGRDGGRDSEASVEPEVSISFEANVPTGGIDTAARLRPGRYVFQVKFHRTLDSPIATVRQTVVSDLGREVARNITPLSTSDRPDHFVLITNVPASKEAIVAQNDRVKAMSASLPNVSISIWWQDDLTARLDQFPGIWPSFPELFAGSVVPFLGRVIASEDAIPKAFRIALHAQFERDTYIRFRQIDLRNTISSIFIDVPLDLNPYFTYHDASSLEWGHRRGMESRRRSALQLLFGEENSPRRILLEGAPGQGKSTVTQMAAQIMRSAVLGTARLNPEGRWKLPTLVRLPFRVEMRALADWLSGGPDRNVEGFLTRAVSQDSGNRTVTVEDLHAAMEKTPTLCIFDGLDEIGTDEQRDQTLQSIADFLTRAETGLQSDIKTVLTTRPPAIAGRRDRLPGFTSVPIAALTDSKVSEYLDRWLQVQCQDESERATVRESFESRRGEPHVAALSRNPMQLSVLLHFIRMKGEAFPDKRAELYREYFKTVIDRDVEKSARLRQHRESIEVLHQLIGFRLHMSSEASASGPTLSRMDLLTVVRDWLRAQETDKISAEELFAVGEERLGLIIAVRGEGETTHYGYEIQPIREYFAAAFLNEQIHGNAHDVFAAMVRRSFWHEVAVFLAGLRRPNERADLLSRARNLDEDKDLGWREDGRRIVLQLLSEGVFAQPGYVYTDGVTLGLSAVDPRESAARYWPNDLVGTLIKLCKAGDVERHQRQIRDMLGYGSKAGDEYSSFRLLGVASGVLDGGDLQRIIADYEVDSVELLGKIRLLWPCRWNVFSTKTSQSLGFWRDETGVLWAKSAWTAAFDCSSVTSLAYPAVYHQRFVEQFAFSGVPQNPRSAKLWVLTPGSTWAVWWLALHSQILRYALSAGTHIREELRKIDLHTRLSFEGLTPDLAEPLSSLIAASRDGIEGALLAQPRSDGLHKYVRVLWDCISAPGLVGWLACRSVSILASTRRELKGGPEGSPLREIPEWGPLVDKTVKMFGVADRNKLRSYTPLGVTQQTGEITPLSDVLNRLWAGGHRIGCDCWLHNVPVRSDIIPALVRDASDLRRTLLGIAQQRVSRTPVRNSLPVQLTQQILAVARRTSADGVLSGALSALLESHFIKLAGVELTSRLIRASVNYGDEAAGLFAIERESSFWDSEDLTLIREIAAHIVRDPHLYSGKTGAAAARFLYGHRPLEMPPLVSEETALGLFPQGRRGIKQ